MHRPQDDLVPLHEPFETAMRGFNRQQVLAHIESLEGHISMLSTDRESALAQVAELCRTLDYLRQESKMLTHLHQEIKKANEEVQRIQQAPIREASVRIQHIVRLAEEEAAEIKACAEREAAEIKARAEREVAEIKARADQETAAVRKRATSEAEALLRHTTLRCKQLEDDSERRRKAAEWETEQNIARRESEVTDRIQRRERRSITGLYLMLKILGSQLAERVVAVERKEEQFAQLHAQTSSQVSALEEFRAKIIVQLATTRQVLAQALEQVHETSDDHPELPQPVPVQRRGQATAESPTVRLRPARAEERHHPTTSA